MTDEQPKVDSSESENILIFQPENKEYVRFETNGDIYVYGRLAENDKEVVDAIRDMLRDQGYLQGGSTDEQPDFDLNRWLDEKEAEYKRKRNKHHNRNNHQWRYGGKVEMIQEMREYIRLINLEKFMTENRNEMFADGLFPDEQEAKTVLGGSTDEPRKD